jgi:hypothetical protein
MATVTILWLKLKGRELDKVFSVPLVERVHAVPKD